MSIPEPQLRPEESRRPSTLGGAIYLVVALVNATGFVLVVLGPWRWGLATMGGSMVLAAVARLALRDEDAGMLKVRRKTYDVVFLTAVGAGLVLLSAIVPDHPLPV